MVLLKRFFHQNQTNVLALFIAALMFAIMLCVNAPKVDSRTSYVAPPVAIKYLTTGMKYQIADSFWLRALQDFDYCDEKINQSECAGKSWLFKVLDLATEIDPVFEAIMYRSGGLALTVIISDYAGATVIFDKGVAQYPTHWPLLYAAGYHAQVEEKNFEKAARLYSEAAENGAPDWLRVTAGTLAHESGNAEFAQKILQTMIDSNQDEKMVARLKERLVSIKKK